MHVTQTPSHAPRTRRLFMCLHNVMLSNLLFYQAKSTIVIQIQSGFSQTPLNLFTLMSH